MSISQVKVKVIFRRIQGHSVRLLAILSHVVRFYLWRLLVIIIDFVCCVTLYSAKAIIVLHWIIWSWYAGRWWAGYYIWYSEEVTGGATAHPGPSSLYQIKQPTHQLPMNQSPHYCIMVRCCVVLMCPLKGYVGQSITRCCRSYTLHCASLRG